MSISLTGSIEDFYDYAEPVLALRNADLYLATTKSSGEKVWILQLRKKFNPGGSESNAFAERLNKIAAFNPPVTFFIKHGVDNSGRGLVVLAPFRGESLLRAKYTRGEGIRIFQSILKKVQRLHDQWIVCGDLSLESFWIDHTRSVEMIGVLGSFGNSAPAFKNYLSPEEISGIAPTFSSDVYSLGVIGHQIFRGTFPSDDGVTTNRDSEEPEWIQKILDRCLSKSEEGRFKNAIEISQEIEALTGNTSELTVQKDGNTKLYKHPSGVFGKKAKTDIKTVEDVSKVSRRQVFVFSILLFVVIGSFILFKARGPSRSALYNASTEVGKAIEGNTQVEEALTNLAKEDISQSEIAANLRKIGSSDDLLAYQLLVEAATNAKTVAEQNLAEQEIVGRLTRQGSSNVASKLSEFFKLLHNNSKAGPVSLPPGYREVLMLLNTALPMEGKKESFERAYKIVPRTAMKFLGAMILDAEDPDLYKSILTSNLVFFSDLEPPAERSALSILFSHPELGPTFESQILEKQDRLTDDDVNWLLERMSQSSDSRVKSIIKVALERPTLSPLKKSFLRLAADRPEIPENIVSILLKSASNTLTLADIGELSAWFDKDATTTLLLLMASSEDAEIRNKAFDASSVRPFPFQSCDILFRWIRENDWENRFKYSRLIGVFAYPEVVPESVLEETVSELEPLIQKSDLMVPLIEVSPPKIVSILLNKFSKKLGLASILKMLSSTDKSVRLAAIDALSGYNDVAALQLAIDKFEREKDPDVIQRYKEKIWVIGEREARRQSVTQ